MSLENSSRLLSLGSVAHRCAQESERFFRRQSHDPSYCFELFRRAILNGDQQAWETLYTQYRPLVAGWVKRHQAFPASNEEVQYFVNQAFWKLSTAVTANNFDRFPDLKSLLRYLQMCVHSAIVDHVRAKEHPTVDIDDEMLPVASSAHEPAADRQALAQVGREEMWRWIDARLNDPQERLVVFGSFALGLKPRELYAEFDETFESVNEVYRIKQNVLARLRRDEELKMFLNSGR